MQLRLSDTVLESMWKGEKCPETKLALILSTSHLPDVQLLAFELKHDHMCQHWSSSSLNRAVIPQSWYNYDEAIIALVFTSQRGKITLAHLLQMVSGVAFARGKRNFSLLAKEPKIMILSSHLLKRQHGMKLYTATNVGFALHSATVR